MQHKIFLFLAFSIVIGLPIAAQIQNRPESEEARVERMERFYRAQAIERAQKLISDRVKCPSTIKYIGDLRATRSGKGWYVYGEFDCQNLMGALVRSTVDVHLESDSYFGGETVDINSR